MLTMHGLPADEPDMLRLPLQHDLPIQPTPLIGRENEVARACGLLRRSDVRLLTLAGPPGIGKTRLGLEVAARLVGDFVDGVYFVPLAPVADPAQVLSAVAQVLEVKESPGRSLDESLQAYLGGRQMLLVLDNFEQVIEAATSVAGLLVHCPGLKVLVTSREVLRLRSEHEFQVPPLPLPDTRQPLDMRNASENEALKLFVQRAQAARPDFQLTAANIETVADICRCIDGLPLAIELAAARVKTLSPQAILARLSNRLQLLVRGARDLPERHQTLRRAIEWSYDLLDPHEQMLFRRLSVFVGGCTLEAAGSVCGAQGDLGMDVLEGVTALMDKSLLREQSGSGAQDEGRSPRFWMLETIREYALAQLDESGEIDDLRRHHAAYFAVLAEQAAAEILVAQQAQWFARLDDDYDNMRAALRWATENNVSSVGHEERVEVGLRLVSALWRYWLVRGHISEGLAQLEGVLSAGLPGLLGAEPDVMIARANALLGAGHLALIQGNHESARTFLGESLALSRDLKHMPGIASALGNLSLAAREQGDYPLARQLLREALAVIESIGARWGSANALRDLGIIAQYEANYAEARSLFQQSLAICTELEQEWGIAYALASLGTTELRDGDTAAAVPRLKESLVLGSKVGDKHIIAQCLEGLACAAAEEGKAQGAATLWSAAEALREATGAPLSPPDREYNERAMAATRTRVDPQTWDAAWAEGRAMPLEEVVALALQTSERRPGEAAYPDDLTPREVDVLRLVAAGLNNAEIAERLYLSRRTVHAHLRSIYGKIRVNNRSAATRYALEHGLI
jgi:predicted ATPase/DNA-binding CsgD family transcriptional regulator